MKKIIISLSVVVAVAAVTVGATTAFFSDTETSTGNTFTAGAIDLTIDNTSYAIDFTIPGYNSPIGALVLSEATTWTLDNLTGKLFFNFIDLKPGDIGEDTISLHVDNNDAWMCMATRITDTPENGQTEPEEIDEGVDNDDLGELQEQLNFVFWADDGDNVLEVDEYAAGQGIWEGTAEQFMSTSPRIVADSTFNIFEAGAPNTPLTGGADYYIAKAWCFGDLGFNPVLTGEGQNPTVATGITCNGASLDNSTQTDGVQGDIEFYSVQSRNNLDFTCSDDYTPSWVEPEL